MKKLTEWQKSERFRRIGSEAIRAYNAQRSRLPKCGAKRKLDGGTCQNLAMANGRCHRHGGKTPKGDDWHKPRWPSGSKVGERKLRGKLADLDRQEKRRRHRLSLMTAEERTAYEKWRASHQPGPASAREAKRQRNRWNADLKASLARRRSSPINAEVQRIDAEIDALRAEIRRIELSNNLGVFG